MSDAKDTSCFVRETSAERCGFCDETGHVGIECPKREKFLQREDVREQEMRSGLSAETTCVHQWMPDAERGQYCVRCGFPLKAPCCAKHGVELAFVGDECWECKKEASA